MNFNLRRTRSMCCILERIYIIFTLEKKIIQVKNYISQLRGVYEVE